MKPLGKLKKTYPATPKAYYDLVKQALFEVQDLRYAMEYEMDGMEPAIAFVGQLEHDLQTMAKQMETGDYKFGHEDLALMKIVKSNHVHALPFRSLLQDINHVHKNGLAVSDD